jgi:hypothetical protein
MNVPPQEAVMLASVHFTHHAIERFIQRCDPSATPVHALRQLRAALAVAERTGTWGGAEVGRSEAHRAKLIIRATSRGLRCMTVLALVDELGQPEPDPTAWAHAYLYVCERADRGDKKAARIRDHLHSSGVVPAVLAVA